MNVLRIGTRASALARWQAENVRAQLGAIGSPAELVFIRTTGDRDSESSLRNIGGKGVFIKEIEDALLDGRVDLAVHSMKDVPTELPAGLLLAAICKRADVRDALVSRAFLEFEQLPQGARVGTTSLRRQAQLRLRRPDLEMVELRGNVDTRLAKVARGDCDAIVLAKAGLDRLEMTDRITEVLSTEICLPAAGQGAVGIEARADDAELLRILRKLNHSRVANRGGRRAHHSGWTAGWLPGAGGGVGARRGPQISNRGVRAGGGRQRIDSRAAHRTAAGSRRSRARYYRGAP